MKRFVQVASATYFLLISLVSGAILLWSTPSFWYVVCAALLFIAGIVWFFRPTVAASFAVPPLLGLAFLLRYAGLTHESLYFPLILVMAIVLAVVTLRGGFAIIALLASGCLVLTGVWIDRTFTQQIRLRTYDMQWSADGQTPWGDAGPLEQYSQPLVVIYRNLDGGYCYDGIYSAELKRKLLNDALPTVKVDYDIFINFGKSTGYHIRTVDGIKFNDGLRSVRDQDGFGGYVLPPRPGPYKECWQ